MIKLGHQNGGMDGYRVSYMYVIQGDVAKQVDQAMTWLSQGEIHSGAFVDARSMREVRMNLITAS